MMVMGDLCKGQSQMYIRRRRGVPGEITTLCLSIVFLVCHDKSPSKPTYQHRPPSSNRPPAPLSFNHDNASHMTTTPTKRQLLSHILTILDGDVSPASANPLPHLGAESRIALQTLHVLFPSALLPALDLLDRHLVTRLALSDDSVCVDDDTAAAAAGIQADKAGLYAVASTRPAAVATRHSGHGGGRDVSAETRTYLVRLREWHCSCPGYVFSLFPADTGRRAGRGGFVSGEEGAGRPPARGGTGAALPGLLEGMAGRDVPVCKHLLACALAGLAGFNGTVTERRIGVEAWVGWCAGWGG